MLISALNDPLSSPTHASCDSSTKRKTSCSLALKRRWENEVTAWRVGDNGEGSAEWTRPRSGHRWCSETAQGDGP